MAYYNADGTVYGGDVHTMADGRIMTGASHNSGSVQVYVTNPKEDSTSNPHITDEYSPLETMIMQAVRRFGDFSPGTMSGDAALMFIEFANMVLDEVRMHPYWDGTELDYYQHLSDVRQVPDVIMVSGLLYHYASQQGSEKAQQYAAAFIRTISQQLWRRLNGNTAIEMRVTDNGTNRRNFTGQTSKYNGTTR